MYEPALHRWSSPREPFAARGALCVEWGLSARASATFRVQLGLLHGILMMTVKFSNDILHDILDLRGMFALLVCMYVCMHI